MALINAQIREFEGSPQSLQNGTVGYHRTIRNGEEGYEFWFRDSRGQLFRIGASNLRSNPSVGENNVNVSDGEGGWIDSPFRLETTADGLRRLVASAGSMGANSWGELSEIHIANSTNSGGVGSGAGFNNSSSSTLNERGLTATANNPEGSRSFELSSIGLTVNVIHRSEGSTGTYSDNGMLLFRRIGEDRVQTFGIDSLGAHWDDEAEPRAPVISSDNGIIEASWGDINEVNTDSITLPDEELNKWRKLYMAHDGKSDWTPANIIMAGIRNQENVQNYGLFTPNSRQIDDESYLPTDDELITKAYFDRNKGEGEGNNTGGGNTSTFEIFTCTKNWLEAITTNGLMAFGVGNQNVRLSTISRGRTSAPAISKGVYNRIGIRLYSSGAVSAGTGDNVRVNVGSQIIPFNMIMPNANAWSNEKVIEANVSPENLVSFEIINLATVDIDSYITVEIRLFNV